MSANYLTIPDVLHCSNELTFIAVVSGHCLREGDESLLIRDAENGKWTRKNKCKEFLVTRDYLQHLIDKQDFVLDEFKQVFFYKKCKRFNLIYQDLVQQRQYSKCENEKTLIKSIINFSCGFFGFNSNKSRSKVRSCRLVTKLNKKFDNTRTDVKEAGILGDTVYYFSKLYNVPTTTDATTEERIKKCTSALPLFICIVETGKMRLGQLFSFLDNYLLPGTFKLCYAHVDNCVLALSTSTLDEAVDPSKITDYLNYQKPALFSPGTPGHLKQEWHVKAEDDWKFATALVQNYAVISRNNCLHKNSNLSNVSSLVSYTNACDILDRKQSSIPQWRRIDKLFGREMKEYMYNY